MSKTIGFTTADVLLAKQSPQKTCPFFGGWIEFRAPHPYRCPFFGICTKFDPPSYIVAGWAYDVCQENGKCPYKKEEGR